MRPLLIVMLTCSVALGGCETPSIESSPMPVIAPESPELVSTGDVLEFRFLRRPTAQSGPYRIGISDTLSVNVYNHPDLTQQEVNVLPDGHISLPLIPRMRASGLTVEALTKEIATSYRSKKIRAPQVIVSVVTSGGKLRAFLDSVFQAGGQQGVLVPVEIDGTIAAPAISPITGGRPFGEIRRELQAAYASEFGPELAVVVRLMPRDIRTAYVIGEVTTPGRINIDKIVNPLSAVARAGGFLRSADLEKVRIYRFSVDRGVEKWQVNLVEGLQQGNLVGAELRILPEDVIYVPKTGIAEANDAMDQYIRQMLPISAGFGFSYGLGGNESN